MLRRNEGGRRVLCRGRTEGEIMLPRELTELPPEEAFKNAGFAGDQSDPGKHYKS